MAVERALVVDASLTPRIAAELRKRGREALSAQQLGLARVKDPELLRGVYGQHPDAVLVTGDDRMPLTHADVCREVSATIATIAPWENFPGRVSSRSEETSDQEAYEHEIVHRWVQAMQAQALGSRFRYFLSGRRLWTPRLR